MRVNVSTAYHEHMTEAYCVKERAKREMSSPQEVQLKNGRRALQGTCSSCGTKLFKILGK
jgi:hypothetical protein